MEFVDKFKNRTDNYTEKIKDCKYFEGTQVFKEKKGFSDICEVFYHNYDPEYKTLTNDEEKENYVYNHKLSIADLKDFDKKKYSGKFTKNLISRGLQEKNNLSSVIYLNILNKCNCVVYNSSTDSYYETGFGNNRIVCEYTKNGWFTKEYDSNFDYDFKELSDLKDILKFDIETNLVFKTDLKSISNYKMDELREIAEQLNIPTKENGKNIVKKELYEKINLKKIVEGL
tara:strand:- start:445 stop:1131 length:687 start_codon:yes stop_codon:yes gene_type:complete